ncbi:MAG TPA: single-stranded DNA-binding protein [Candidatus Syntrophosphaera sp.]|jgi:single-strand DNA-binding protein|nr:single-stranded DNA-binding protein [Candidatus Syntrophosphaera sp.]HOD60377.1 single-stranded DNA-binding protein [Candidatus Syntrophosphaera sp.]HPX63249.1 single-stranded DNA-binding protein [Candidatus Syntrophosphaera thermopropionivorans]
MADLRLPRLNKVFIAGRITQEPELRYTPKGTPVVRFTVVMDRNYKDEMDQWQSVPVYIDVVAWSYQAENICKIAHKGTAVLLEGRINTRSYVDSNNINRKVFEIIADHIQSLERIPKAEGEGVEEEVPLPEDEPNYVAEPVTDDDVPF